MERAIALKRLRKILGKDAGYRVDPKAPSADERAAAKDAEPALIAARQAASKAMEERAQYLLDNDSEYLRLREAAKQARDAAKANASVLLTHKITVGISSKMFFHVRAQANSWEDIFKILERQQQRR
jgi:hypothetical protein